MAVDNKHMLFVLLLFCHYCCFINGQKPLFPMPETTVEESSDITLVFSEKLLQCQAYTETGKFVRDVQSLMTATNVRSLDACLSLCWLLRNGFKCRSVNYNSNNRRCDVLTFMPDTLPLEQTTFTRQRHSSFSIPTTCVDAENPDVEEPTVQPLPQIKSFSNCGISAYPPFSMPPTMISRIVGGMESRPHSLPWTVSIQANRQHICGGTLIQMQPDVMMSDLVVTAAHCVLEDTNKLRPKGELNVQLGIHRLSLTEKGQVNIRVKNMAAHPEYNFTNPHSDIALVQLEYPTHFSKTIRPACIPKESFESPPGLMCLTAGWGLTSANSPGHNDHLLQVYVPVLNITQCSNPESYGKRVYEDKMLCAGYMKGAQDACQGDSGGPLVCKEDNRWVQHGVVSFGDGCGDPNKPGIYTKISTFLPWLESVKQEFAKSRS